MSENTMLTEDDLKSFGITDAEAGKIAEILNEGFTGKKAEECWMRLINEVLHPDMPASLHQHLFQVVYDQDEQFSDAPPAWKPDEDTIEQANITKLQKQIGVKSYKDLHRWSVTNRPGFWDLMVNVLDIPFKKSYERIVEFKGSLEQPQWLEGAEVNIADACFQSHPDEKALVYGFEDGSLEEWRYKDLERMANRVANGLDNAGFEKGDKAAVVMPMTAEAVAIYLGIVKIGGAVVSIADSLAPEEVEKRLAIADTQFVFTQDVIPRGGKTLPLYDKFKDLDGLPQSIVLPGLDELQSELRSQDYSWDHFLSDYTHFQSVSCNPDDHCNILFSSGTTGEPKAIPWTHVTPVKCAADGYLHHDIKEKDVVAWPTNIGWMMGPWLIFAALINKGSVALFYGAPTGREFGKFVQDAKINMLGLVPSMVKRWLETDCMKGLDWSRIKVFSSTGESSNPRDYLWLMARGGYKPVIEYCGGTEVGGGYLTGTVVQPASPATFSTPAMGLDIIILDDEGYPSDTGEVFIIPPSMGLSNTLLNKDHRKVYYANVPKVEPEFEGAFGTSLQSQVYNLEYPPIIRRHGDEIQQLPNGYFRAHGRADDTMNLGGIKTSSVEIERLLDLEDGIKETAAIGVDPKSGGPTQLVVYAVSQENTSDDESTLHKKFQKAIKEHLNPLFKVTDVVLTDKLPRTASNKIMRRVLRDQYQEYNS